MTVEGKGEILRNLRSRGGAISFVDQLYFSESGSSDSYPFTITVRAGETLFISAWWEPAFNTDHTISVKIDGATISPTVQSLVGDPFQYRWTATFWTRMAGLSAGDHDIGLVNELGAMDCQGGLVIFHVPDDKIGTQHNT